MLDALSDEKSGSVVFSFLCSGNVLTEPLPSNDRKDTHADTKTDGRDLLNTPLG
jgi:hypothetical protein